MASASTANEWHTRLMDNTPPDTPQGGAGRPDPVLYPDIASLGSLQVALQAEFGQAAIPLTVLGQAAPGWRYIGARIEDAQRHTNVVMGLRERVFTMDFWLSSGVRMAHGNTPGLSAVVGATQAWQSGMRVRDLNATWPFVRFSGLAEAHERGEAAEYTWQRYHQNPEQAPHLARLHAFITLAIQEPRLRALLPFTSMGTLCFSNTPGYPYTGNNPHVTPIGEDRY